MQRRTWLKLGVALGAVVAVVGVGPSVWQPGRADGRLTPAGQALMAAVAGAVLQGLLPTAEAARAAALNGFLARFEATVAALPTATQADVDLLLSLLCTTPARWALTGDDADWTQLAPAALQRQLQALRHSGLAARQQAYHALRDLSNASYLVDSSTWSDLGYPGPALRFVAAPA